MNLPHDLKNYRAPWLFDAISDDPALVFIVALIAALVIDWVQR